MLEIPNRSKLTACKSSGAGSGDVLKDEEMARQHDNVRRRQELLRVSFANHDIGLRPTLFFLSGSASLI